MNTSSQSESVPGSPDKFADVRQKEAFARTNPTAAEINQQVQVCEERFKNSGEHLTLEGLETYFEEKASLHLQIATAAQTTGNSAVATSETAAYVRNHAFEEAVVDPKHPAREALARKFQDQIAVAALTESAVAQMKTNPDFALKFSRYLTMSGIDVPTPATLIEMQQIARTAKQALSLLQSPSSS